ncbi:MAG TPA: hypothetical protein VM124_02570 [Candidatus Limnocylindrales bacterium]|nr:hypothetical protein [Candidatus Limnocylindrales bacterium]
MTSYSQFLGKGETPGEPETFRHDNVDFDMVPVTGPDLGENDRVILNIRACTEPCILIAGEPFTDRVIRGMGRLSIVDLAAGKRHMRTLIEGEKIVINPGSLYWYANDGLYDSLLIKSTCPGFNEADEPSLRQVVQLLKPFIPIA